MTTETKPMSGWRRLWIVASILAGVPTYYIAADSDKAYGTRYGMTFAEVEKTYAGDVISETCEGKVSSYTTVSYNREGPVTTYDLHASCQRTGSSFRSFLWSLLPAILMAAIGLTMRWIYRGFRPLSPTVEEN